MPIRMVDDENQGNDYNPNQGGGGSNTGGGGNLGGSGCAAFLPMILSFVFKKPKIAIPLLLIGGAFYFFSSGILGGGGNSDSLLSTGADLDVKQYDKASVYAATEAGTNDGPALPEFVSLERYAPQRLNQGSQGSCVGWGSSYAARTILESIASGQNPDDIAFSPSFVYNNIGFQNCQGSYINKACDFMQTYGNAPLKNFAYDENSCSRKPSSELLQYAQNFKIRGAERLSVDGDDYTTDFYAIKQHLANGSPVICGMLVGGTFMSEMYGQKLWQPSNRDYDMQGFGGHCMCIIGYDDRLAGGSFQIMNSWGPEWGENGIAWVRYEDFMQFNKEAYALYPLPKKGSAAATKFACAIGLVNNSTKQYIPLQNNGNLFTSQPVAKGTKFKIEVQNTVECYTYIFGQETDGSSYVLFPYTAKHSPFCGVTGYRLFPKSQSLMADDIGNKDFMAIVVTKEAIDYKQLNTAINNASGDYRNKVQQALGSARINNVVYQAKDNRILFQAETNETKAVAVIVEINKQ